MGTLKGKIAVVTGASRGIGKGIAIALGERGATVYVTGRTTGDGERTIDTTARLVTEAGGEGRAIRCDHGDDAQIAAVFEQIGREGRPYRRARQQCLQDPRPAGVGWRVLGSPDPDLGRPGGHRAARPLRGELARPRRCSSRRVPVRRS